MNFSRSFLGNITRVIDGDTVDVEIDLGFNITHKVRLRLRNLDTYELRSKDKIEKELATKEKDYLESLVLDKELKVIVFKKGKYGRYIADLIINNRNVNDDMLDFHNKLSNDFEKILKKDWLL